MKIYRNHREIKDASVEPVRPKRAKGGRVQPELNRVDDGVTVDRHGGREFPSARHGAPAHAGAVTITMLKKVTGSDRGRNRDDGERGRRIRY